MQHPTTGHDDAKSAVTFREMRSVMDTINTEMGKGTLRFSAEGMEQPWKMRRGNLTSGFTTAWDGLPVVAT